MKVAICLLALIGAVVAEPPVPSNRYLPASNGNGIGYANGNGHHHHHQNGNGFGAPSAQYGTPSTQYGAPLNGNGNGNGFAAPSAQYGAPSAQYGAPAAQYGPPSAQYGAPSSQYGAPSNGFNGFANGNNGHGHHANGARSHGFNGLTTAIIRPNTQYGAPQRPAAQYGAPRSVYGAPNGRYQEEAPASYQFQYAVEDAESGNDFGHQEAREGDVAIGKYYVTLPNGRKQTVEYTADNEGYKPMISYEDVSGGYSATRNGNGGYRY